MNKKNTLLVLCDATALKKNIKEKNLSPASKEDKMVVLLYLGVDPPHTCCTSYVLLECLCIPLDTCRMAWIDFLWIPNQWDIQHKM